MDDEREVASECESCGWRFADGGDPPQVFVPHYGRRQGETITWCSLCFGTQASTGKSAEPVERTIIYCANAILAAMAAEREG